MIIEYIRYIIQPSQHESFEKAYQAAFIPLLASPYCLAAELSKCTEEADSYILRIEWTSENEHMTGFRQSTEFQEFLALIRAYIPNIQEMRHYSVIESATKINK